MFQDLDDTLKNLLNWKPPQAPPPAPLDPRLADAAPDVVRTAEKSFLPPDRNFKGKLNGPTISLFLHRIQENLELRQTVGFLEPGDDPTIRRQPLLRVDCSYLVTSWSFTQNEEQVKDEHELLGKTLFWLGRFRTIPSTLLAGSLQRDDFPLPYTMAAHVDPNRIPVDFWTGLGIAPRPSFDVTVTIAIDLAAKADEGPPVTDRELDLALIPGDSTPLVVLHRIGGSVLDPEIGPIAGASVEISSQALSRTGTTDPNGQFQFDDLPPDTYRIRAVVTGIASQTKLIQVPRGQGDPDYNMIVF